MRHQKKLDYTHSLDSLFVLSEEIRFIAVINIFGEVIKQYNKNMAINPISREEISNQFHNIAFATSVLTLENIKFMLLEKYDFKIAIINLSEDNLMIGIDKEATWPDILDILRYIIDLMAFTPFSSS
ncbi:MAG TPA: hypothetical protein VKA95_10000 [Nitrososphaeraceae archaeon]|nr:hypothetical protein [Nitrososphaeraceae archaeon]